MTLRNIAAVGVLAGILALELAVSAPGGRTAAAQGPKGGSLTGQLLVATPEMGDPRFARTVIYMVHHDATGAMGLVVNRPFKEVSIALLLERLGMDKTGVRGDIRVHYGGPVEPGRAFIVHTTDYTAEGTQVIKNGIALTGRPAILRAIAAGTGPRRALFVLGYAGWAPGQLEAEIATGAWATAPADPGLVFGDNYEEKWDRAMARRKIDL